MFNNICLSSLILFSLIVAARSEPSVGRYACSVKNVSVHEFKSGSFQRTLEKGQDDFFVDIKKVKKVDDPRCDDEIKTPFNRAFCQMPYEITARSMKFYGEDIGIFRGYQPWQYFVLFDDGAFTMSFAAKSVMISSGTCVAVKP
jgi:hypothetical protein